MDEIVVSNCYFWKSIGENYATVNDSPKTFVLSSDDEELPPFQITKCDEESIRRKENAKISKMITKFLLQGLAARAYGLQPPTRFCDLFFFEFFQC